MASHGTNTSDNMAETAAAESSNQAQAQQQQQQTAPQQQQQPTKAERDSAATAYWHKALRWDRKQMAKGHMTWEASKKRERKVQKAWEGTPQYQRLRSQHHYVAALAQQTGDPLDEFLKRELVKLVSD